MKLTLCGLRRNRVLAPVGSFGYRRGARQPRMTIGVIIISAISASQARAIAAQLFARTKLGEDGAENFRHLAKRRRQRGLLWISASTKNSRFHAVVRLL